MRDCVPKRLNLQVSDLRIAGLPIHASRRLARYSASRRSLSRTTFIYFQPAALPTCELPFHESTMSTRYKIYDPEGLYFLTLTTVGWLDIFTRKTYKDILIESLRYCQENKGLLLYAFVIMSNHLHLIVQAKEGVDLIATIGDFKKYTARQIIDQIQESGKESRKEWLLYQMQWFARKNSRKQEYQMWQSDNHPEEMISPKFIYQKLEYLHFNPVKAGLVEEPAHYVYSSAAYYEREKGILPVRILDLGATEGYVWMG